MDTIQRYRLRTRQEHITGWPDVIDEVDGDYVKFEDHEKIVKDLKRTPKISVVRVDMDEYWGYWENVTIGEKLISLPEGRWDHIAKALGLDSPKD